MYELYFDGGAVPNPGVGGAGAVLYKDKTETHAISVFVGENETNNTCEYTGLIKGLELAIENKITDLKIKGDSQLVIKQMKGEYQVKAENLKTLHQKANELASKLNKIEYIHIKREFNKRADELATEGMNKKEIVELIPEVEDIENAPNDNTIMKKGKYKGKTYKEIRIYNTDYLVWLLSQQSGVVYEYADFIKYCMDFLKLDIEDT